MIRIIFFLSSGLFLGWSLGANDAANIFGTAVGTKMIRFRTAAIICSIFVIIGAVVSGAGASHTLGKLGAVNELASDFIGIFCFSHFSSCKIHFGKFQNSSASPRRLYQNGTSSCRSFRII